MSVVVELKSINLSVSINPVIFQIPVIGTTLVKCYIPTQSIFISERVIKLRLLLISQN